MPTEDITLPPVLTLHQKQWLHVKYTAKLIAFAESLGNELTWGETLRDKRIAELNAASGAGISNSLHLIGLAVDFRYFINGIYQTDSAAYKPLGDYWCSLNHLCRWGGNFAKVDGDHFSITHNGIS